MTQRVDQRHEQASGPDERWIYSLEMFPMVMKKRSCLA